MNNSLGIKSDKGSVNPLGHAGAAWYFLKLKQTMDERQKRLLQENLFVTFLSLLLMAPILYGYGMNIWKLSSADFQAPYKAEVLRGIGVIVPPVGVVTGYLNLGN